MQTQFPIAIGLAPNQAQGARITNPVLITSAFLANNFMFGTIQTIDLVMEDSEGAINNIQTMFVDASWSPAAFLLTFPETQQTIYIKAKTQGYYPIAMGQQGRLFAQCYIPGGSGYTIAVQFLNVPIAPCVWPTQENLRQFGAVSNSATGGALSVTLPTSNPLFTNNNLIYKTQASTGKTILAINGFDYSAGAGTATPVDVNLALSSATSGFGGVTPIQWELTENGTGGAAVQLGRMFNPPLYPAGGNSTMTFTVSANATGLLRLLNVYYGFV